MHCFKSVQVKHDIGEIGSIMFHNSNEIHTIDILLAEAVFSFIDINYHQVQACLTFIDVTAFLSFHIPRNKNWHHYKKQKHHILNIIKICCSDVNGYVL